MKNNGWDYLDHMLQTCEELFECMQNVDSADDLMASVFTVRATNVAGNDTINLRIVIFTVRASNSAGSVTRTLSIDIK